MTKRGGHFGIQGNNYIEGRQDCILRNGTVDANTAALSKMYTVDDNLMTVFKFINGKGTVYSFTEAPVEYSL